MRDYGVVRVRFWEWAKRKKLSLEARDLALYLLTSPHGNSLGCFRLPMAYLCDDLDTVPKAATKTLEELQRVGFVHVDEEGTGWIWIVDYLDHNPIPNGNVGKAVGKMLEQVPRAVSFYADLLASLHGLEYFPPNLIDTLRERYLNGSDRVSRTVETHTHTHEHDQEHEHTHDQEQNAGAVVTAEDVDQAFRLFNDAAKRTGWPEAQKIDDDRKRQMRGRLREVAGVEGFAIALGKAEASEFLTEKWPNFNIDWLLKPKNFRKVMEGNYDKRNADSTEGRSLAAGLAGFFEAGSR